MVDDYERTVRVVRYYLAGIIAGGIVGVAGGVAAQEYFNGATGIAQVALDVLSGIGGGVVGAAVGYICGRGIGTLVNEILEEKNNSIQ